MGASIKVVAESKSSAGSEIISRKPTGEPSGIIIMTCGTSRYRRYYDLRGIPPHDRGSCTLSIYLAFDAFYKT